MLKKFLTSYLWIALLTSGLVMAADQKIIPEPGTWNILELQTINWRFFLKKPPAKNAARDVALIVIDEESYKKLGEPLVFYHTYIAAVINYLVRGGARVIGLDIELPSISLENRVSGGYESVYTRTFLAAKKQGVDVVIGFSSSKSPPLPRLEFPGGQAGKPL